MQVAVTLHSAIVHVFFVAGVFAFVAMTIAAMKVSPVWSLADLLSSPRGDSVLGNQLYPKGAQQ